MTPLIVSVFAVIGAVLTTAFIIIGAVKIFDIFNEHKMNKSDILRLSDKILDVKKDIYNAKIVDDQSYKEFHHKLSELKGRVSQLELTVEAFMRPSNQKVETKIKG